MDFLEFGNLQQLIYADLARNIGEVKDVEKIQPTADLLKGGIEVRDTGEREGGEQNGNAGRIFMPASRVNCHIGFAQMAMNLPAPSVDSTVEILLGILDDIPDMDFDETLMWDKWALPDQLTCMTVSAVLRIASLHPHWRPRVTASVIKFVFRTIAQLRSEPATIVLTQYAPSFHGLYRAIISSPFAWSGGEWCEVTEHLKELLLPDTVDHLNELLPESLKETENDVGEAHYVHVFLSRYVSQDRPLSGYFIVCCVVEIVWTVLGQALSPPPSPNTPLDHSESLDDEATAANSVWLRLTQTACVEQPGLESAREPLEKVSGYAMRCFSDLLAQIEDMDVEPSLETYAWETMSESLKLASICSVACRDLNSDLLAKLRQLLSEDSPVSDHLVQEAALKATTIVVLNFPSVALLMSGHLRRFVTSPLPIFEYEFAAETSAPPPLAAAAKCLSLCIKLAPSNDFVMSNMYSLLNYISATSKEPHDSAWSPQISSHSSEAGDTVTVNSLKSGLQTFNEEQQRLIGISTISVVTCLAVEFKIEEVTRLTISMLLQRLRTAEPTVEAAIVYNLVDLAIISPETSFVDIIKAFSFINRSANPDDPRFSINTVVASQTRLAQELRRRPEFRQLYLTELLSLFIDKGMAIQNSAISNPHLKTDDMVDQLGSLLLPIDALLSQRDFEPALDCPNERVTLFRNMWFLCVLFGFTSPEERGSPSAEWQIAALTRIAIKTPHLVLEEIPDFVTSTLEYNTVIRQEYAQTIIQKHRLLLQKQLPTRHGDIRHLLPSQIIFLLTMGDIEAMRSSVGFPSSLPLYFVNTSVNGQANLSSCMDGIVDKVIQISIGELSNQVVKHSLPDSISNELRLLLAITCHRVFKARDTATKYLHRLITSFPSLMCDPPLVFAILEVLTMLRRACEGEYTDEFDPTFEFHSDLAEITLHLSDSYKTRNEMLNQLQLNTNTWFGLALARSPIEFQATLQKYLAAYRSTATVNSVELGASIALQFATAIGPSDRKQVPIVTSSGWKPDRSKLFTSQVASKEWFAGETQGLIMSVKESRGTPSLLTRSVSALKSELSKLLKDVKAKSTAVSVTDLRDVLLRCASAIVYMEKRDYDLIRYLVALPFEVFGPSIMTTGIEAWTWVIGERADLEMALLTEIEAAWNKTIEDRMGLFSTALNYADPFSHSIEYAPTDKVVMDRVNSVVRKLLVPHTLVLQMLLSRFQAARYRKPAVMRLLLLLVLRSSRAHKQMSTHPLARETRFSFLLFGFEALKSSKMDSYCEDQLRGALYATAYSWFSVRPQWTYGANRVQVEADVKILKDIMTLLQTDAIRGSHTVSSSNSPSLKGNSRELKCANHLLRLLIDNELYRLIVWDNPTYDTKRATDHLGSTEKGMLEDSWGAEIRIAWRIDPGIVVYLPERFKHPAVEREAGRWIRAHPREVLDHPEALKFVLGERLDQSMQRDVKHVLLSGAVPPVTAVGYFEPRYNNDPILLQYAYRVLEEHDVSVTFFFVPQIVQALRHDSYGYVRRFIFDTAKVSQLFCHQIIWNMKANCYKDDSASVEDPMKPQLDEMTNLIVESLSGQARGFYDKEFGFFNEVTSISGKLKPYIKKSKAEKKDKIDEEMAKIKVEVDVYLPSNPDGVVVDIDRKSGRPLQSHAKAPFMASFKVRKKELIVTDIPDTVLGDEAMELAERKEIDVWQSAIFKVGDDCRQDVLALQVIAMFKNIFTRVGLNLYLFPYRVTATAPGCGVIDVVPNATSRDEMGRAKVNDLLGFFASKYGGEDSIRFQRARLNFIQSMAGYSVACYILQIKDRHNGNIMIDGEGHIVHIDFGFLFDIDESFSSPCFRPSNLWSGIKFEPNSFKLNREMVELMGGRYSQGYTLFQQLTVKAFLAIRPYTDEIVNTVELMLGTELPSFKGEGTIKRLRDRFAPGLNERQAAEWMMGVVRNAHENMRSTVYDEFQRLQNGIPYK